MLAAAGKRADAVAYLGGAVKMAVILFGPDPANSDRASEIDIWAEAGCPGVALVIRDPAASLDSQLERPRRAAAIYCRVRLPRDITTLEAVHTDVSWEPNFDPGVLPLGTCFTYVSGKWQR